MLQINLNRSRGAQDLMQQYIREMRIEVAFVSEPSKIPGGNWLGDGGGLAAIHWSGGEPCALIKRGVGYVVAERGKYRLISVYCSPNVGRDVFVKLLEDIGNFIGNHNEGKVIIGGDLNARSEL